MRRSVVFTAPRTLEVQEEAIPVPGPGQVLVQAEISAPSAGTEVLVYRGQAPEDLSADATIAAMAAPLRFPLRYGYSLVGRIVGDGRRVFAFHPHESHFLARPEDLVELPEDLDPAAAVFLPNMETAVNLLHDGRPRVGERVAVFGQGIVGLLTVALLARFPLAELAAVDPVTLRREAAARLGADPHAPGPGLEGFDLAYEVSGRPETLDDAIAATGFSGRVVIGSWYGTKRAPVNLGGAFHRSRIRILSSQVSTLDPELTGAWTKQRRLRTALDLLKVVRPERLITHRFPVQDAADAYALLDAKPGQALQVVLTY